MWYVALTAKLLASVAAHVLESVLRCRNAVCHSGRQTVGRCGRTSFGINVGQENCGMSLWLQNPRFLWLHIFGHRCCAAEMRYVTRAAKLSVSVAAHFLESVLRWKMRYVALAAKLSVSVAAHVYLWVLRCRNTVCHSGRQIVACCSDTFFEYVLRCRDAVRPSGCATVGPRWSPWPHIFLGIGAALHRCDISLWPCSRRCPRPQTFGDRCCAG